jgi:hypothetical protein
MIGKAYPYSGSPASCARLNAHLWSDDGQTPELSETRNLYVSDSLTGLAVMRALKNASRAEISFWHIIVAPRFSVDQHQRRTIVDMVVEEFNAHTHPLLVFAHKDKPRARRGGGGNHVHLLLGHVCPSSRRALVMRHVAPRLHKVMAKGAFFLEGHYTRSPWQRSIVESLKSENELGIACWLVESERNAPKKMPASMNDRMRRAAAAANFDIAWFQAHLERLWANRATEEEVQHFLREIGVGWRTEPDRIAFYVNDLFVGQFDRIVRQTPATFAKDVKCRFPNLFGPSAPSAFSPPPRKNDGSPKKGMRRPFELRRQRLLDELEKKIVSLALERVRILYDPKRLMSEISSREAIAHHPFISDSYSDTEERLKALAARVDQLLNAERIIDFAIQAVWLDDELACQSMVDVISYARRHARNMTNPGERPAIDGAPPSDDLHPLTF